jgi:hypothetical protein
MLSRALLQQQKRVPALRSLCENGSFRFGRSWAKFGEYGHFWEGSDARLKIWEIDKKREKWSNLGEVEEISSRLKGEFGQSWVSMARISQICPFSLWVFLSRPQGNGQIWADFGEMLVLLFRFRYRSLACSVS